MDPHKLAKSGSEHGHQSAFMLALLRWSPEVHAHTFAVPNGAALAERGKSPQARLTGAIRMNRLKAEGLKTGVPDVFVAWPQPGGMYAGLFIEFKVADKGVIGPDQKTWRERLQSRGYAVRTVFSWKEAINATCSYFGKPDNYTDVGHGF